MKYVITETQNTKLKEMIAKSIDKVGIIDTIKRYKLDLNTLSQFYHSEDDLDCEKLYKFINTFISNNILETIFITDKYGLWFDYYSFDGTLGFTYKDNEFEDEVSGYATPYWDGGCATPVDITFYNNGIDDFYDIEEKQDIIPSPKTLKLEEINDWYKNDYIKNLIKIINREMPKFREEYKKD